MSICKKHVLTIIGLTFLWGLNGIVSKVGIGDLPPLFYITLRSAVALPALLLVPTPDVPWRYVLSLSVVWGVLQWGCMILALKLGASVGVCALLLQSSVFFTMGFSLLLLKERPTLFQMMGALLGLTGILLLGWETEKSTTFIGFLLSLAASACWGFGNVLSKKAGTQNSFSLTVWSTTLSVAPLLALSGWWEGEGIKHVFHAGLSWTALGCILYAGLISNLFAGSQWLRLIQAYSPTQMAVFSLLVPLFSVLLGVLLLDEEMTAYSLAAGGLIISGLLISQKTLSTGIRIRLEAFITEQGHIHIKRCHKRPL